jgi:DNA-directed RNA polymerase specialized sigma24 family protein
VRRALLTTYLTWRRRRWYGERAVAVIPDVVVPGDPLAATDLRVALARLLPSLPTRQRAVLVLRYYEDLSETQTADLLGCSVGTSQS